MPSGFDHLSMPEVRRVPRASRPIEPAASDGFLLPASSGRGTGRSSRAPRTGPACSDAHSFVFPESSSEGRLLAVEPGLQLAGRSLLEWRRPPRHDGQRPHEPGHSFVFDGPRAAVAEAQLVRDGVEPRAQDYSLAKNARSLHNSLEVVEQARREATQPGGLGPLHRAEVQQYAEVLSQIDASAETEVCSQPIGRADDSY